MSASSSIISPAPRRTVLHPIWSQNLGVKPGGLVLAREKGTILTWDEKARLHLFARNGERQASLALPGSVTAACSADDGSAHAAIGGKGQLWWLAPDLTIIWEKGLPHRGVAIALDPFGQYVAASDRHGGLHIIDRHGRPVHKLESPRPLHHLAFVPAAPLLLGSADYGLVACFDLKGQCVWRDGLVAHVGSLAVAGDGSRIVLTCFTEGLQGYDLSGKNKARSHLREACRLAGLSFDGRALLVAGLSKHLLLVDGQGETQGEHELTQSAVALALGALAELAVVAQIDGQLIGLELREGPSP